MKSKRKRMLATKHPSRQRQHKPTLPTIEQQARITRPHPAELRRAA